MNALNSAKTAYAAPGHPIRTARGTEYEIFARITQRLRAAQAAEPSGFAQMAGALHDNRKLWTTLAADVAGRGNGLPEALRARIFYLAEFTRHHSRKVLAREASADTLIEINTAIMRGLRDSGDMP